MDKSPCTPFKIKTHFATEQSPAIFRRVGLSRNGVGCHGARCDGGTDVAAAFKTRIVFLNHIPCTAGDLSVFARTAPCWKVWRQFKSASRRFPSVLPRLNFSGVEIDIRTCVNAWAQALVHFRGFGIRMNVDAAEIRAEGRFHFPPWYCWAGASFSLPLPDPGSELRRTYRAAVFGLGLHRRRARFFFFFIGASIF